MLVTAAVWHTSLPAVRTATTFLLLYPLMHVCVFGATLCSILTLTPPIPPRRIDLSSTVIPVDDEEEYEEEEETYDDIEGVTHPPLPRPGAGPALQRGRWGEGQETGAAHKEEEDEDIYEVLPGIEDVVTSRAEMHRPTHTHTDRQEGCTHKLS